MLISRMLLYGRPERISDRALTRLNVSANVDAGQFG